MWSSLCVCDLPRFHAVCVCAILFSFDDDNDDDGRKLGEWGEIVWRLLGEEKSVGFGRGPIMGREREERETREKERERKGERELPQLSQRPDALGDYFLMHSL